MSAARKAAIIGGGVIGGGWAARFALNGAEVSVFDPDPEAERKINEIMANAQTALRKLYVAPLPSPGSISYAATIAEAVEGAGWVQESVPERLDMKHRVYAEIQETLDPEAVIGSSTSGFKPSQLQEGAKDPTQIIVAHPFNPVYLLPLVELVPGPNNDPRAVDWAQKLLRSVGMHPLLVRKEIDAHIADRFLEAVWREALWLVKDGIATTAEIDDAIRLGFGLRWAQMGLFETYRVAGGEAGMRHFMEQFGPALKWPWTKLMDVPEFTDELVEMIASQSDAQSGAHSIRELERIRDEHLVGFMQVLKARPWGAGEAVAEHEKRLRELSFGAPADSFDLSAPLPLHSTDVQPEWVDYNGHMTEYRYLHVFGDTTDAFLSFIGMDEGYLAGGHSVYTVETHLRHIQEVAAGRPLKVSTQLLGLDDKRIRIAHIMQDAESGDVLATAEHMLLSVDTAAGRACAMVDPLPGKLSGLWAGHQKLAAPDFAGRSIKTL